MVKCISAILLAAGIAFGASAQTVNEVTLVVSGDGTTKEAATHNALRSAIEQAFGTFVSANTSILNDELIKDEIVSVSSGNIQKYTELGSVILPNGNTSVTLQATVSIGKLISYTQNKGHQCEFAGQTFAMQLKLDRLNFTNAEKAIDHLIDQLKPLIPNMFDFRLRVYDPSPAPSLIGKNLILTSCSIYLRQSPNVKIVFETLINTLTAIHRQPLRGGEVAYFVLPDGSISSPKSVIFQKQNNSNKAPWSLWDQWNQFKIPENAAHKLMIFLTREITSALLNWRIKDNLGTIYEPKYSGKIRRGDGDIYTPKKQKASTLAEMPLISDIIKKIYFTTSIYMPRCENYDFQVGPYVSSDYIVCFPFYDMKTKGIKSDMHGDDLQVASVNIYIPENQIDKFSSFSIEHK